MTEKHVCPECGAELPENSPEGLCPRCLLAAGLADSDTVDPSPPDLGASCVSRPEPGSPPALTGQFGDYRIVRPLGRGGMGAVYEAEHLESGRRMALKVLSHGLDSPATRKRFLREGRLAASINHPNSVYVYGTEEIEGSPAISMELVAGGTLADRVEDKGPMPIAEAVDAILQVMAGLEAAHAIGILHRDVKPSNCFVDIDGTVKVGDFGLSISTSGGGQSHLTVPGALVGTPTFSSPEQLRGDVLDVRSDIYAVGVTLYYLLTGKAPFQSNNVVKLIAAVLDQPAKPPSELRSEIPKKLNQIVLRCLAKQSDQRFSNYNELRRAMMPFSSTEPTPGSLRVRFLAGFLDFFSLVFVAPLVASLLVELFQELSDLMGVEFRVDEVRLVFYFGIWVLYFGIAEGFWGASIGKAVCGLRVTGSGGGLVGVPRAVIRVVPCIAAGVLFAVLISWAAEGPCFLFPTLMLGPFLTYLVLFSTARENNGYAGLHELLSNTRVVAKSTYTSRPSTPAEVQPLAETEAYESIGPYHVLQTLRATDTSELVLGFDGKLLRRVWIRRLPSGGPPVAQGIRNLGRAGRLRWLSGTRSDDECWDAYEAPTGKPLLDLIKNPQPWSRVRYWLLDLAQELSVGTEESSLPPVLALDRVWITADGRAKLLDFPAHGPEHEWPEASRNHRTSATEDSAAAQRFLWYVAMTSLQGRPGRSRGIRRDIEEIDRVAAPLPLHAKDWLNRLGHFDSLGDSIDQLKPLLNRTAVISARRRLAVIVGCWFFPALLTLPMLMFGSPGDVSIESLRPVLERAQTLRFSEEGEERRALEVYLAGHSNILTWSSIYANVFFSGDQRREAVSIMGAFRDVSEEEINEATAHLAPLLDGTNRRASAMENTLDIGSGFLMATVLMLLLIPIWLAALISRGGLVIRLLGIAVVTWEGSRVGRLRVFWRNSVAWSPLMLGLLFVYWPFPLAVESAWVFFLSLGIYVMLFAAAGLWSVLTPTRSLQDRIAGTWLVPI